MKCKTKWLRTLIAGIAIAHSLAACTPSTSCVERSLGGREFMYGEGFQEILPLPDGKRVLAVFRTGQCQHLWMARLSESTREIETWQPLTSGARYDFDVAYNEKTDAFVFCSIPGEFSRKKAQVHLWKINADGTGLLALSSGNVVDQYPAFDPEGRRIAFSSYATPRECDLWLYDLGASERIRLTESPDTHDAFPRFCEDGRLFFFRGRYYGHNSPIACDDWKNFAMMQWNFEKKAPDHRLDLNKYARLENATMTPDARALAVMDIGGAPTIEGNVELYTLSTAQKMDRAQITSPEYFSTSEKGVVTQKSMVDLTFSPKGNQMIFITALDWPKTGKENLHRLDLETMKARQITRLEEKALRFTPYQLRKPVFLADGKTILFLVRTYGIDGSWEIWRGNAEEADATVLAKSPHAERKL